MVVGQFLEMSPVSRLLYPEYTMRGIRPSVSPFNRLEKNRIVPAEFMSVIDSTSLVFRGRAVQSP